MSTAVGRTRYLGFRVVAVGVATTVVGFYYGTVCTSWVVAPTGNACLQYGNGVSGLVYVTGFGIVLLGILGMLVRGEFAGLSRRPQGMDETSEVPVPSRPNCPVCGEPLVRVLERERWYCVKCKEFR